MKISQLLDISCNARKRRAPNVVEVLHISGGCLNVATKERSEFRRTAVGRRASLVTFLSRTRKLLARRCDEPTSDSNAKASFSQEGKAASKPKINRQKNSCHRLLHKR